MAARRKNGEGTFHKRKDGRWEGRIVIGYNEKGVAITKSVTSKDKAVCEEKLNKLKKEYESFSEKKAEEQSFGAWLDYWYNTYCKLKIKESTQSGYENSIYRYIIPMIGSIPLKEMTQNDLQKFYDKLKEMTIINKNGEEVVRAGSFVRRIHSICFSSLKKAEELGMINTNYAKGCKIPPKKPKEIEILTKAEMYRFLIQAKEYGLYEFFLLELSTGMRRGEILGLQWNDINLKTGQIDIVRQVSKIGGSYIIDSPKTRGSVRTLMIPKNVLEVLKKYREEVYSEWVFPSPVKIGEPRNPGAIKHALNRILERAECKHVRFHDLRHTFVTMALENNMDIKTLSGIIGHASARTTLDVYSHINDEMIIQATEKINRGIAGKETQTDEPTVEKTEREPFVAKKGKYRKPGTGCVSQINEHLYEGRYSPKLPNGKRISRNVYAKTREECEILLAEMIKEMKAEIQSQKEQLQFEHSM